LRENRQLRNESEFLKSRGVLCRGPEEKYEIIKKHGNVVAIKRA
jgi:hypothetical protein